MRCVAAFGALAVVAATRDVRADPAADARVHRAAAYAVPVALLASSQAPQPRDYGRSLGLVGWSSLSFPFWTADNEDSMFLGLGAFVLGSATVFGAGACSGGCRAAILAGGLGGYSILAVGDVAGLASGAPRASNVAADVPSPRRWYGWGPLIGYGSVLGGIWLATIDEAGLAGAGLSLASQGLEWAPLAHFRAGRSAYGWVAFGGTLLGAGLGALAACAGGCGSAYAHGTRAVFEPGRALVGATAGIAMWGALDSAFLSYGEQPTPPRASSSVQPFLTTSPTTGRPRAGMTLSF